MSDELVNETEVTEDPSMITTKPTDMPKSNVDLTVFPHFTLPRYTDSWSECRNPGAEMYEVYTVDEGTYFDESVVIDEYAEINKSTTTTEETETSEDNNG